MKSREEVELLKRNWLYDPCWDIYESEGFEEYRDELRVFQINQHVEWRAKEYNRLYGKAQSLSIENLGDKDDEPNLNLMRYLESLESKIYELEATIARNFHILTH